VLGIGGVKQKGKPRLIGGGRTTPNGCFCGEGGGLRQELDRSTDWTESKRTKESAGGTYLR